MCGVAGLVVHGLALMLCCAVPAWHHMCQRAHMACMIRWPCMRRRTNAFPDASFGIFVYANSEPCNTSVLHGSSAPADQGTWPRCCMSGAQPGVYVGPKQRNGSIVWAGQDLGDFGSSLGQDLGTLLVHIGSVGSVQKLCPRIFPPYSFCSRSFRVGKMP